MLTNTMEEMKMKNLMKKSVVSAVVVLAVVSLASAGPAFLVGGASSANIVEGTTVTVELMTDAAGAKSMTLQQIADSASITGAASNLNLPAGWDWADFSLPGVVVNSGGVLIENATGAVAFGHDAVNGLAYSFDYTVAAPVGEVFTIGPGTGTNKLGGDIAGVSLTVVPIPEPMTVALLGLGCLFLRRKK